MSSPKKANRAWLLPLPPGARAKGQQKEAVSGQTRGGGVAVVDLQSPRLGTWWRSQAHVFFASWEDTVLLPALQPPCHHPWLCHISWKCPPSLCGAWWSPTANTHTLLEKPQGLYFHGTSCKHRSQVCQLCVAALWTSSQCSQFLPGHQRKKKYFVILGTSKEDSGDADSADVLCNSLTHDFWEYSHPVQSWFPWKYFDN